MKVWQNSIIKKSVKNVRYKPHHRTHTARYTKYNEARKKCNVIEELKTSLDADYKKQKNMYHQRNRDAHFDITNN